MFNLLLRRAVDLANTFFLWLKKKRRIEFNVGSVAKVNVGCGLTVANGWHNIDGSLNAFFSTWPDIFLKTLYKVSTGVSQSDALHSMEDFIKILKNNIFIHHQFEYGLPFHDQTVDYIYSSHLIEHLFKPDAEKLLKEAHRCLKPEGLIRVCVPSLEHAFKLYQDGRKDEALNFFFTTNNSMYFNRHRYMYDFELLKKLLESIGFVNVRECSYKQGSMPDIEQLDVKPEQTLFVEAKKQVS